MLEEQLTELLKSVDINHLEFRNRGFSYKNIFFEKMLDKILVWEPSVGHYFSFEGYDLLKAYDKLIEKNRTIKHFLAEKSLKSTLGFV